MRIPTGNFGGTVADVIPQEPTSTAGSEVINRAAQNLAGAAIQTTEILQQNRRDMARAKAANALADHELTVKQTALDVQHKVQSGELPYQDAQKTYADQVSQIQLPQIDGADPITMENLAHGAKQITGTVDQHMQSFVFGQQQEDYRGQFVQFLDTQQKLAGMPGSDIEAINNSAGATAAEMARKAGLPDGQAAKMVQDFKDANWFNNATEKAMANRNNIEGLKALENELSAQNGFYVGKLDTNKRDALLGHVMTLRTQLENKIQIQADRQDVKAQRALLEMDQQISTGVPATAAQWDAWSSTVKGTNYEADYKQRLQDEQQVQQVLRLPIDQQTAYVQQERARLTQGGGNLHEIANVQRLSNAVAANVKQLQETPLLYAQARTGEPVQPLDLNQLFQAGGENALVGDLKNRVDTINALQKQYGTRVQMRPLLPEEAATMGNIFSKLGVHEKELALATLHSAVGGAVMVPMMQEVAKNDPVLAVAAGMVANQTSKDRSVANLVLQGDDLLRNKQVDLPPEANMNDAFQKYVGNAIQTIPGKQAAYLATKAAYAQLLKESGTYKQGANNFDTKRFQQAAKLVTGGVFEYNGTQILPPVFGYDESQSRDALRSITPAQIQTWGGVAGMTPEEAAKFIKNAPLESIGIGKYRVTAGAGILRSQSGGPFIMSFQ